MLEKIVSIIVPKAYAVVIEGSGGGGGANPKELITNPAVTVLFGTGTPSAALANIIVTVWRTAITLGGLALLVMLIMGALEWITAGGDKGKIESARDRITQSIIGLLVLLGTVGVSIFVGNAFGINLLKPQFAQNITTGTTTP